jgi:translation initiation factor IF-1
MPDAGEGLQVSGRILEALPGALFRVALTGTGAAQVTAHLSGGAAGLLRLLPGDQVVVELMPYDMTRGRIVRRRSEK